MNKRKRNGKVHLLFPFLLDPLNETEGSQLPGLAKTEIRLDKWNRIWFILNRIEHVSKPHAVLDLLRTVSSFPPLFRSGEMVRLFLSLSPAISRLNIYPVISLLATYHHSLRLQKHSKLTFSFISPSSSSNFQRKHFYSKSETSILDDKLVVLGIESSCDDTAAAVVSPI